MNWRQIFSCIYCAAAAIGSAGMAAWNYSKGNGFNVVLYVTACIIFAWILVFLLRARVSSLTQGEGK